MISRESCPLHYSVPVVLQDPDPKQLQVLTTGFLESKAPEFVNELWNLLLSAQDNVAGIPAQFVEQKKEEIRKRRVRMGYGSVYHCSTS